MLNYTPELAQIEPTRAGKIKIDGSYDSPLRAFPTQGSPEMKKRKQTAQLEYYNPSEMKMTSGPPTFEGASTHPYARSEVGHEDGYASTSKLLASKHSYMGAGRHSEAQKRAGPRQPSRQHYQTYAASKIQSKQVNKNHNLLSKSLKQSVFSAASTGAHHPHG